VFAPQAIKYYGQQRGGLSRMVFFLSILCLQVCAGLFKETYTPDNAGWNYKCGGAQRLALPEDVK